MMKRNYQFYNNLLWGIFGERVIVPLVIESDLLVDIFEDILKGLTYKQINLLHLYYDESKSYDEIASIMGISWDEVNAKFAAILRYLRYPARVRRLSSFVL